MLNNTKLSIITLHHYNNFFFKTQQKKYRIEKVKNPNKIQITVTLKKKKHKRNNTYLILLTNKNKNTLLYTHKKNVTTEVITFRRKRRFIFNHHPKST